MPKPPAGTLVLVTLTCCSLPLLADSGSLSFRICNAGTVEVDAFAVMNGQVVAKHLVSGACALVYDDISAPPAYLGFAFTNARGQWGAPRRLDLIPDFDGLDLANQNVPVPHGNTNVSVRMPLVFRPHPPPCKVYQPYSEAARLPLGATPGQIRRAEVSDALRGNAGGETICEHLDYTFNVLAYPDTSELTFKDVCEPCQGRQPQIETLSRPAWSDLGWFEYEAHRQTPTVSSAISLRATVSGVERALPGARVPRVTIHFKEPELSQFAACLLGPEILEDLFGAGFQTSMVGKTLEIDGALGKGSACDRSPMSISVTLARQIHLVNPGQTVARTDSKVVAWSKPVVRTIPPPADVAPLLGTFTGVVEGPARQTVTLWLNWDGRPSAIMKSSDGLSGGLAARISRGGKQVEFQPCAEYLAKVQPGCASDPQIILSALASEDGNTLTANIYVWMWRPRESPITLTRETPSGVVSPQPARAPATPGAPPAAPPRISTRLDDDRERFDALLKRYRSAYDALYAVRRRRPGNIQTAEETMAMERLKMVERTIRSAIAAGDTARIEKELAAGEDAAAVLEKAVR
jgi:hypothetical protein